MRSPFHPGFGAIGIRRAGEEVARPIASGLNLGNEHSETIDQSHERCAALGVSRIERPDHAPLARNELGLVRERNARLHDHAAPVMEMLYEQIVNTQSMVLLTDATGTIIHAIGDDDFLSRANKVALQPGVNWSESTKGTNAVGTALVEEIPTLVHADEHYLHANHFLTCSAAPILDPRGNILGVLDVSGDQRSYHQHTMALVKMSARMIENHWLTDDYRNVMRLHFHSRVEFIGTLMEGILAVSADGKLVGANRGALEQLGMSGAALRMHTLTTLFGTTVGALVDRFRSPLATPMPVQLQASGGGRSFHLHARFNWPVWTSLAEAVSGNAQRTETTVGGEAGAQSSRPAPTGGATAVAHGGLAQLRTGDTQMASVVDKIRRVLDRDIPILVLGETGTGKELLARAIHVDSARAKQPFVAVNCASIPESLIEAELFGYEDGAFTGARRKGQVGKIVQANGGTLFLDEIGDMPIGLQAHLLRVLQERQVTPLGSSKSVAVDVSIICATHRNLRQMIDEKAFREDLFYRLNGLAVRLPPLRERSDLAALVQRILERQLGETRSDGRVLQVSPDVMQLFQRYHWPGNVRQLFNVLRTAAVMAAHESVITREHLSDDFLDEARQAAARRAAEPHNDAATQGVQTIDPGAERMSTWSGTLHGGTSGLGAPSNGGHGTGPGGWTTTAPAGNAFGDMAQQLSGQTATRLPPEPVRPVAPPPPNRSLEELEIEAIRQALEACGGNISEASKRLGISRNTIYRKLRWNQRPVV